ncbi:MAG: hypothetical protein JNM00_16695, partial [Flavobacteriales bacterium]|nr:hypothetical protein [Flavobacteriales bacterium]
NLSFTSTYYVRAEGPCGMSPCASITVLVQNFGCIADLDLNNQVDTNDLLLFLAVLGCTGNCLGDFTNDDAVNTSDLLIFLSYFGLPCP